MRVEADRNLGVSAHTVGELRKVTAWPENLVIGRLRSWQRSPFPRVSHSLRAYRRILCRRSAQCAALAACDFKAGRARHGPQRAALDLIGARCDGGSFPTSAPNKKPRPPKRAGLPLAPNLDEVQVGSRERGVISLAHVDHANHRNRVTKGTVDSGCCRIGGHKHRLRVR